MHTPVSARVPTPSVPRRAPASVWALPCHLCKKPGGKPPKYRHYRNGYENIENTPAPNKPHRAGAHTSGARVRSTSRTSTIPRATTGPGPRTYTSHRYSLKGCEHCPQVRPLRIRMLLCKHSAWYTHIVRLKAQRAGTWRRVIPSISSVTCPIQQTTLN
jgi:hypothetical protein